MILQFVTDGRTSSLLAGTFFPLNVLVFKKDALGQSGPWSHL